jgi:hypothetical protein
MWKFRANRKQWDIAIANHAGPGQLPRSMLSPFGAGAEHVATFQKTKFSQRQYCNKCGGHLMTNHPTIGLVDVYAATLPTLKFSAGVHINYVDTVLPMRDGLPKLKDLPQELGGSGEGVPE